MKPTFLMLIFRAALGNISKGKSRIVAREAGYTMYCHNGSVYSTADDSLLFQLTDLV